MQKITRSVGFAFDRHDLYFKSLYKTDFSFTFVAIVHSKLIQ